MMDRRFSISLICLLLVIPHNRNSPLPQMESWSHKEQDEGFLDRELTSSLTNDQNSEFAHQNYQNSLIRQRKSIDSGVKRASQMSGKRRNYANGEKLKQEETHESDSGDVDYKESYIAGSDKSEPVFEDFEGGGDNFQVDKYQTKLNDKYRNNKAVDARYYRFRGNDRLRNVSPLRNPVRYRKGDSSFMQGEGFRGGRGSLCGNNKNKYAPDITLGVMEVLKLEGGSDKGKNFENDEESSRLRENEDNMEGRYRIKNELSRQELKSFQPERRNFGERSDPVNENLKGISRSPVEGEYYYETEVKSPGIKENDENFEVEDYYDQLNDHDALYKREESKQQPSETRNDDKNDSALGADVSALLKEDEKNKPLANEKSELTKGSAGNSNALKEQNDESVLRTADLVWKMNNNLQAKELSDVMKDSQRALEEVQLFQQKLDLKANNNPSGDVKFKDFAPASSESKDLDQALENRAKREDEDEQKNMKTGTDEGGGGEYEDEEGKGHNDEEEYYEEMDDANKEENEKNLKRATRKDENIKNINTKLEDEIASADEDEDEDDELSLKNAPVENVEDQKKFKLEGKKDEKKDVRKGPKIWDQWGKWSPCSVTCGVGRSVRWRHCIGGGCAQGEKEAQIKKCTNPAC